MIVKPARLYRKTERIHQVGAETGIKMRARDVDQRSPRVIDGHQINQNLERIRVVAFLAEFALRLRPPPGKYRTIPTR